MSDLVKDLPAEYRTPSLESLPEGLQRLAVQEIKRKFGLGHGCIRGEKHDFSFERLDCKKCGQPQPGVEVEAPQEAEQRPKSKFKAGDRVVNIHTGKKDTVQYAPGDRIYDAYNFSAGEDGMILEKGLWKYQADWELDTDYYEPKKSGPTWKPADIHELKYGDTVRFNRDNDLIGVVKRIDHDDDSVYVKYPYSEFPDWEDIHALEVRCG